MRGWLAISLRAPRLTIAVLAVVTAVLAVFAARIRVDSAIENLLPDDDADRRYYQAVRAVFGSEEATIIGMFGDVFAPESLATIDRLSDRLAELDGVREVLSLTTVKGAESDEVGVRIGPLMRALPRTAEEAAALRAKFMREPLYLGSMVAPDGSVTAILVLFEPLSDAEFLARDLEGQVRRIGATEGDGDRFAITGVQTLKVNGARLMEDDLAKFVPLALGLVIIVLIFEFRTVRGVLLPLSSVIIGTVWTTGLMVLAGSAINMGTLILPPLLMAIGIAYAIHVVSRYYVELRPGRSREEVAAATIEHIRLPVTVAWITTVAGCATLIFNPIHAIREFGIYSVVGISVIFIVSLLLIPAALVLLPEPPLPPSAGSGGGRFADLVGAVGRWAVAHRRLVLVGGLTLCGLSIWGATRIRIETNYLEFFDADSIFRRDNRRISEALGGTQPIYVTIDGDAPGAVQRLETLAAIRDLQAFIAEQPGIDGSLSLADYVAIVQGVLNPERGRGLPDTPADVDQLLLFVNPEDIAPVAARDYGRGNIIVRTRLSGSTEVGQFARAIEEYARSRFRHGTQVHVTGSLVLLNRSADDLARGQIA